MKKLFKGFLAAALVLAMAGCGGGKSSDFDPIAEFGSDKLNVYNWGVYIGEDVIANFEQMYNVTVSYSLFSSNEEMYTKLMSGASYDILVPSDYMIERLIAEDMLQPIDKTIVDNLDNLTAGVRDLAWDPDNTYSVPYLWGSVGIVYDATKVDQAEVEAKGWDIFLDEQYKGHVYMYDSERDAFMVAFKALGYSMNTENEDEIQAAYNWLRQMDKAIAPDYVTDEAIDGLAYGEKWMGLMYSGDAAYILSENENMRYYEPQQGTNIWVDAMVIPANAASPKLANAFIKYITDYEASLDNSRTVGYTSPNDQVLKELSESDFAGNSAYVPRAGYALDEVYTNSEVLRRELPDLWIKVKLHE